MYRNNTTTGKIMFENLIPNAILAMTVGALLLSQTAAQAWTLTPMKLERTLKPGESFTDVLVIDNAGASDSKRFEMKIIDWSLDKKGSLLYTEPGVIPQSFASGIICSPMQFKCAPGERKLVRYTLTLPKEASPGEHTVGIQALEVVIPPKDAASGRINVGVAVKCGFLCAMSINVPTIQTKQTEPVSLNFEPSNAQQQASILLQVKNDSNARVRPFWSFTLLDQEGKKVYEEPNSDHLILRESERIISCPIKANMPVGKYKVVGKLDQGVTYPVQELEKEFEIQKAETYTPDIASKQSHPSP
ncbi:MAG: hypothetical protein K2X81_13985 [Candidatus Obscuribacterales bacterium]|nr:hypothetical protein [Candidatus Obscuribacterales bacterium]